ncbi:S8 family peptidase [Nonomuraea cavernae]|uniref:Peptidase n=1 Tax=Nonomuraea cavernae TaxID=2045107 RepID=A0A917ZH77_9ACTN|nr:S8 family peptidase [Nonomuraea cavernae]MCA2190551.1 S8 family peptidase [Nonomuraea cavernae]GGO82636.1 peptidase [Nonomuraea cavernae]
MRWIPRLAAIGAGLAMIAVPVPAHAAAPEPAAGSDPHRVTLITGDVVTVQEFAGGKRAATVRPGKGRENIRFFTREENGDLVITPADMVPYLSRGLMDERLFAVSDLIEQGYDDESSDVLPLILAYKESRQAVTLKSVNARTLRADKDALPVLWAAERAGGEPRLRDGLAKIWLDGKVTASLEHSVPQVGAPQAWQDGYDGKGVKVAVLDTGIDETHPDVATKVTQARNFTDDPSAKDEHGHGTHVAATVAGTGEASGGLRKGVAPGAELINGKVLNAEGSGTESQVLAGMEWAARESGADIVNMSLGGGPTDGTDPLSTAVDVLTEETGSLFVIAAGNQGGDYTVGAPGAAASALTVGAVDANDALAPFSSRGPRLDEALKPDITAPGVSITAARAAGTGLGTPVDDRYTKLSGTSMATPHVAGAAAVLAQRHPEWKPGQLKDALVSTAKTVAGQTPYEQGGGRLDVARAVRQGVTATASLSMGVHDEGGTGTPGGTVTYTNTGQEPVSLTVAATLTNLDGAAPGEGAVKLSATTVTVDAGASAAVETTVDLARLAHGRHVGYVTATTADGSVAAHTTLALTRRGRMHTVRFTGVDRDGSPARVPLITMYGAAARDDALGHILHEHEGWTVELPEGTYHMQAIMNESKEELPVGAFIVNPELPVTSDMEVVLDARTAVPIEIRTSQEVMQDGISTFFTHRTYGSREISLSAMNYPSMETLAVTPTAPVRNGTFEFSSRWQLAAPRVTARLGRDPLVVRPTIRSPEIAGSKRLPLVHGGTGDMTGLDVKGKAVVITSEAFDDWTDKLAGIAAAGAAVVFVVGPDGEVMWQPWSPVGERDPLPTMMVTHDRGQALLASARTGRAVLDVTGQFATPYLYEVMQVSSGQVPQRIVHEVNWRNTARVDTGYQESGGGSYGKDQRYGWRPWQTYDLALQMETQRVMRTPLNRAEYVSSGDTQWQHVVQHTLTWESMNQLRGGLTDRPRTYRAGEIVKERWFAPVVRPAALAATRTGDVLSVRVPEFVDADGHYGHAGGSNDEDTTAARVYRDGELLEERTGLWADLAAVPEDAEYRLELSTTRTSQEWRYATATESSWTFRSARPAGTQPLPLLGVDYDVPADLEGKVRRTLPVALGFTARDAKKLTAEMSYDDGRTWKKLTLLPLGQGRHKAVVSHRKTDTGVSLRVTATGASGQRFAQTVTRAYGVE